MHLLSSFLTITQNPWGVLTACAGGHVGMLDRELAALLSLVHIYSRGTCCATRSSRRPSARWSPIEISTTRAPASGHTRAYVAAGMTITNVTSLDISQNAFLLSPFSTVLYFHDFIACTRLYKAVIFYPRVAKRSSIAMIFRSAVEIFQTSFPFFPLSNIKVEIFPAIIPV